MRTIQLTVDEKVINLETSDNKIRKSTLINLNPAGGFLTYDVKGEVTEQKVVNKKQDMQVAQQQHIKRVICIGWKHRVDASGAFSKVSFTRKQKIELNGNYKYSVQELKEIMMEKYVDDLNEDYFVNAEVEISNSDGVIVEAFQNSQGIPIDFWTYGKENFKKSDHYMHVYLLTTKITSKSKKIRTDSGIVNVMPQSKSEKNFYIEFLYYRNSALLSSSPFISSPEYSKNSEQTSINMDDSFLRDYLSCSGLKNLTGGAGKKSFEFLVPGEVKKSKKIQKTLPTVSLKKVKLSSVILGEGAQGTVYKGSLYGTKVAVKIMIKGTDNKVALREITLLGQIRHPNIVFIMAVGESDQQFQIITEYFPSLSLHSMLFDKDVSIKFPLDLPNKKSIAHQVGLALSFLHESSPTILHRDVKPSNILVNRHCVVKLCNLGLGKCEILQNSLASTMRGGMCGTYMYMSPEIFLRREEATAASDVWSYGSE
ncbi:probable serine/threonine-protein kinase PBL1 [Copidosoma floridanum]|uniref:probable serine/threonine-protein kinase PBL1 n=1 Tax=Copidosoma floridanum TaxID=29053 RepID=UPI0006C98784|nr:probable serine/threonine-protein kinase PBL1 [Copidosoma floridanum]